MLPCESLVFVHFDRNGRRCGQSEIEGTSSRRVAFRIEDLMRDVVRFGSRALLIVHTHPAGSAAPSRADVATTQTLARALSPLNVSLHDHLVVAGRDHFSFRRAGLL